MTFHVELLPNARRDRDNTLNWFDTTHPEHSEPWLDDFYSTARRIETDGLLPPIDSLGLRHISFNTYRYHVWYRVLEGSTIAQIVAILHQSRDPSEITERAH